MALSEEQFPELIRKLYETVGHLQAMFPGRPFTPDGHMVGSLAECYAEYYYGLKLYPCSNKGHDAHGDENNVEIKATQGQSVSLRSCPEKLLVFHLKPDGSFEEIYNGDGAPVWQLVAHKPKPSNGQYQVRLSSLKTLMKAANPMRSIPRVRAQQAVPGSTPPLRGGAP